jgi:diacylglycerol kinase (ATP)
LTQPASRLSNAARRIAADMEKETTVAQTISPHKGKTGFERLRRAFFYSIEGLIAAYRGEDAFRQEVLLAVVLIPVALLSPVSGIAKALLIGSVLLVLIVELLNSAIEAVTDRVSIEDHVLAKQAKDMGSAAVLVSLVLLAAVWGLVFLQ